MNKLAVAIIQTQNNTYMSGKVKSIFKFAFPSIPHYANNSEIKKFEARKMLTIFLAIPLVDRVIFTITYSVHVST